MKFTIEYCRLDSRPWLDHHAQPGRRPPSPQRLEHSLLNKRSLRLTYKRQREQLRIGHRHPHPQRSARR
jgi:hypothetical protein